MSIKQRLVDGLANTVAERKANPSQLSPMQQKLAALIKQRDEMQTQLDSLPTAESIQAEMDATRHEQEVLKHRIRILTERATTPAPTTTTKQTAGEKQMWTPPTGMDPVLAAIMKFQMEEQNR